MHNVTGHEYQVPRNALALLLVAVGVVVLPHVAHLSPWATLSVVACAIWRTQVYRGRWRHPHWWTKTIIVVLAIVVVLVGHHDVFSVETATALLIMAFALKLIEMKSRRDAYVVVFLAYFVVATQFLFSQTLLIAVYELFAMVVVTAVLVALHQPTSRVRPLVSLKTSAVLLLQAIPLAVILFLFFPRLAPLWSVPTPGETGTGLGGDMRPGDIAELSQSDALAFRVDFVERIPPNSSMYWRGITYDDYVQGTWHIANETPVAVSPPVLDEVINYEVLLEPTQREWLFSLGVPASSDRGVYHTADHLLHSRQPVVSMLRYTVRSDLQKVMQVELSAADHQRYTRIPDAENPRLKAFARELRSQHATELLFAQALLTHIRQVPFAYTLQPGKLEEPHSIDQFWFDTRKGFCSHYAGAFVYAMRSVGIPARLVAGYQGGEINAVTGHLVVRQYDAHAWVEVWLPNLGWQRFDPTAAVAPERIEQGLNAALSAQDRERLGAFTSARLARPFVAAMLDWFDAAEHKWNLWVVGFDDQVQSGVLRDWFGEISPMRIGIAMLLSGGLCLVAIAAWLFWRNRRRPQHPLEPVLRRGFQNLAMVGFKRGRGEAPGPFLRRVLQSMDAQDENHAALIEDVEQFLYNPDVECTRRDVSKIRAQLAKMQLKLAFA